MKTVLVTGANGFIARNLLLRLRELGDFDVIGLGRESRADALAETAARADFVFHLAGVNRPADPADFLPGNAGVTENLCSAMALAGNDVPIVFASSTQADAANPYGESKRAAEEALRQHPRVRVFRLPNVFGKWARPNYNSVVATFCHNVARGLPIQIHDPEAPLRLVYIDDVVTAFLRLLDQDMQGFAFGEVEPTYQATVGEVAEIIRGFPAVRDTLVVPRVGTGLIRALHATFLSYLEPHAFAYGVPVHGQDDPRGIFVEMLKTPDAGQFSYFVAHPGVTRGDHYHHSKTEKFLVISGTAHFGFRHVLTGEKHELVTRGGEGKIVETIPGWTHNVTNIGDDDLVCMLWANEIFDRQNPDTIGMKV